MRKITTFLLFVSMLFSLESYSQTFPWAWQNPTPQGNRLNYVKMWNATTWYAAGWAGTFMKTTNAGTTWTLINTVGRPFATSGQFSNINDAQFFNMNTGIAIGGSGSISRTTNGGTNWDTIPNPIGNVTLNKVYFYNNNTGYVVGLSGNCYKTTDAGLTWNSVNTGATTSYYDVWANDSLVMIATTAGNIRRSTDAGATWTGISTGASVTLYRINFSDAMNGYVSGTSSSFRYTTDGGLTWTLGNTGLPTGDTFYDIDIRSTTVTPPQKLNESFDDATFPPTGWGIKNILGTATWVRSTTTPHSGAGNAYINYDAAGGDDWLVSPKINGIAATDSLKFWWRNAFSSAFPPDSLHILVSTTDTLAGSFTIIQRINTAVTPNTWTQFAYSLSAYAGQNIYIAFRHFNTDGNGGYLDDVTVGPPPSPTLQSTVLLTGDSFNLYKTTNNGTTWDTVGFLAPVAQQPWTSTYYATDLNATGDTLMTVGTFGLINKRNSAGNRVVYTNLIKPGINYDVWAQSNTGNVIVVGARTAAGVNDQILRSTNGGNTFSIIPFSATSSANFNCISMIDNNTGYVCGTNSAVYKTTNAGLTWDSVVVDVIPSATLNLSKVDFVNAQTGWVFSKSITGGADTSTIFKTTNGGLNWTKQFFTTLSGSSRNVYSADMIDANTGYLVNYTPRPYKTTDGGDTWTLQPIVDVFSGYMYDIYMVNANTGYISGSSGKLYKTTNGGTLWDTVTVPTRSYTYYGTHFLSPEVGMIFGSSGTSFSTSDGGTTWQTINTTGATNYNGYITPDGKAWAVGTNGYIQKNVNTYTGINSAENELLPTQFALDQNYPNPFNPSTTIRFAMPKSGLVTLRIYDMAGREVMNLINNQQINAGIQKYTFNASSLASGVYFYSLIVNNNIIDTKKMVLIK